MRGDGVYLLVMLRTRGVPDAGLARLLSLRRTWLGRAPALDGFVPDGRLHFARWLIAHERLSG